MWNYSLVMSTKTQKLYNLLFNKIIKMYLKNYQKILLTQHWYQLFICSIKKNVMLTKLWHTKFEYFLDQLFVLANEALKKYIFKM